MDNRTLVIFYPHFSHSLAISWSLDMAKSDMFRCQHYKTRADLFFSRIEIGSMNNNIQVR